MKKILLFIAIGLLSLIIVAVVAAGFFIGPIVKTGAETLGPQIAQVAVKLKAVDVSLLTGSAAVKGLIVGNPKGYQTPEAIKVETASISLDPFSVFSDKIRVRSIYVKSPEITYDGGLRTNNLSKILENVNAAAKKGGPAPSDASTGKKEDGQKPAPKIEVDDLLMTGAKVHVYLKGISSQEIILTLPDIHLTGLGKDSDGITAAELVTIVFGHITSSTVKTVASSISSSGKIIQNIDKNLGKEAGKNIDTVTKGISGLLGK